MYPPDRVEMSSSPSRARSREIAVRTAATETPADRRLLMRASAIVFLTTAVSSIVFQSSYVFIYVMCII